MGKTATVVVAALVAIGFAASPALAGPRCGGATHTAGDQPADQIMAELDQETTETTEPAESTGN